MIKLKIVYSQTGTWGEFSDKLVKRLKLPNGSRFALSRKKPTSSSRPYMRSDFEIRRKALRAEDFQIEPDMRISAVCDAIERYLTPSCRSSVIALGPDGQPLSQNRKLKTWQAMPGATTIAERNAAELRREIIADIQNVATQHLTHIEEGIEDPHFDVPEGVILALMDRYGVSSIRHSLQQLRLP